MVNATSATTSASYSWLPVVPPVCQPPERPKVVNEYHQIWGDPHLQDVKGTNVEDQIEANKDVLLLKTDDGASITGHTTSFDNPELRAQEGHDITVFDKEVVSLGDGQKILFNSDGTAYHVDANGNLGAALKDGESVHSGKDANDYVTYSATNRTLNFNFNGADGSNQNGLLTGLIDPRGNYINTGVSESGTQAYGFVPALKADFTGVTVDSQTGAGAFDPNNGVEVSNKDFYVDGLYNQ